MADGSLFAGYRLIEFGPPARAILGQIAERLTPFESQIAEDWLTRQFNTWQPPGFDAASLGDVFSGILGGMLHHMRAGELEACIDSLEEAGSDLARRKFPFSALIISVHFLEASYMPFLLSTPLPDPREWLVTMDEFLHVALAAIANAYFEAYREELLEQAEVSRIVQESLLGHVPKRVADLDIAYVYISAEEQAQLGGDFLDSFSLGGGVVSFVIGDLSGHGIEAAAESVMLRSLFRGFMREEPDMAGAMSRTNRVVCEDLGPGHFATALAVSYDSDGGIGLVNAGHPYPVLCDGECRLVETHNSALAISRDSTYSVARVKLEPGAVFVAYTDGLIEARGKRGMYGEEGLLMTVSAMRNAPPRAIVDQLVDDALRFAGGRFSDDVAVLVLKRRPVGSPRREDRR